MTRQEIRHIVAGLLDDKVVVGKATDGTTTTIIDTVNLIHTESDQLKGNEVYVYEGTNTGFFRIITAFDPDTNKITFPAMPLACDTTTKYEIHRKYRLADYDKAIDMALNTAQIALGRDRLNYYVDKVDEILILNDLLMGAGQFERWPNGEFLAPEDFTKDPDSTIVKESTIVDKGDYSAKLANKVSNAGYLQWTYQQYLKYAEKKFTLKGRFLADTDSRVRALITDGVTSAYSDYHTGGNGFENFKVENFEMDASPTALTIQLRTETGTAISAYWDNVRLLAASALYSYDLPTYPARFATIAEIWMESGTEGVYNFLIPHRYWSVQRAPIPKLVFDPNYFIPTSDRRLKIIGQARAQLSREVKDEYTIAFACWYLAMRETGSAEMLEKAKIWAEEKGMLLNLMRREKQELQRNVSQESRALPDSVIIEAL